MALMWRPGRAARSVLILVAVVSVVSYVVVEKVPSRKVKSYYKEKRLAARRMEEGMKVIREHKLATMGRLDTQNDPLGTGMIGQGISTITSKEGVLLAKQLSANPNFAAVFVQWYKRAGLQEGDVVAMAFSGSFPAMNLAALVAAETLGLKPIPITSVSASRWGANDPNLTWLDMERLLVEKRIIKHRSVAASIGGEDDIGRGLPPEGVQQIREAIRRNGVELIYTADIERNFDWRMNIYREAAGDRPIKCFVNIGGGLGSVGTSLNKRALKPGLNRAIANPERLTDSVLTRFVLDGVPVVNVIQIEQLARSYRLQTNLKWQPRVGEGGVFVDFEYNKKLTWAVLLVDVLVIFLLLRLDVSTYLQKMRELFRRKPPAPAA